MRLTSGRTYSLLACAVGLLGIAGCYVFLQLVQYRSTFEAVVEGTVEMDLTENTGLRRALREAIHEVEATLSATEEMKQLAIRFEYPPLGLWSTTLAEQVAAFDLDEMSASLQGYPDTMARLRDLCV